MADDPKELADQLEREAEQLERHSAELHERVEETRQEYEHKKTDGTIPGGAEAERGSDSEGPGVAEDA